MSSTALDAETIRGLSPTELFSLEGSVAIVTGAAGGIGRWLAAGLGAAGASVLVTDVEDPGLDELETSLRSAGIDASALVADLADEEAPDEIVRIAVQRFGAVHVLVNNAAVNRRMTILEMDGETWDRIVRINLRGAVLPPQRAARGDDRPGRGRRDHLDQLAQRRLRARACRRLRGDEGRISQFTRHMALEWAEHGIRVNAIAPGFMDTPLAAPIWEDPEVNRWIITASRWSGPGTLTSSLARACCSPRTQGRSLPGRP